MKLKRMIAMVLVAVMLFVGTIAAASAGSVLDVFSSIGKTVAHGLKTIGNAVVDTFDYITSDKSASECYENTINSANKVAENACDIANNAVQVVEDLADLAIGSGKVIYNGVCAAGTALYETEEWIRTGNKDYSLTNGFVDGMSEGYKQADNGIFTDVAMIGGTALGLPTYAIVGANMVKTGVEYAVDYKTGDEAINSLLSSSISAITLGTGAAVGAVGGTVAGAVAGATVNAGTKIATDLVNDKDNRSALDIVMEDLCTSAVNSAVTYGARTLGEAYRGDSAANAGNNDALDEMNDIDSVAETADTAETAFDEDTGVDLNEGFIDLSTCDISFSTIHGSF